MPTNDKKQAKAARNEARRLLLIRLINEKYNGVQARLADDSGIPESYISRMLYEEGKLQKKNITENMVEAIENGSKVPGWFSGNNTGTVEQDISSSSAKNTESVNLPFSITYESYLSLEEPIKDAISTILSVATKPGSITDSDCMRMKDALTSAIASLRRRVDKKGKKAA